MKYFSKDKSIQALCEAIDPTLYVYLNGAKHVQLRRADGNKLAVPGTPSDHRSVLNFKADLKKFLPNAFTKKTTVKKKLVDHTDYHQLSIVELEELLSKRKREELVIEYENLLKELTAITHRQVELDDRKKVLERELEIPVASVSSHPVIETTQQKLIKKVLAEPARFGNGRVNVKATLEKYKVNPGTKLSIELTKLLK
jgi:hypothetical protein